MQSRLGTFLLGLAVAAPLSIALAQKEPTKEPTKKKYAHPNLVAADKLCAQALIKLDAADAAGEGATTKARDLLKQAQAEIRRASEN